MTTPPTEPRNTTLQHFVTIEATFASDIQRDVSLRVLVEFLEAWRTNVGSAHRRNKITIAYEREQ
jgi:hypothetical protein